MIKIEARVVQAIKEHAARTYPLECCGALLAEKTGHIIEACPMKNIARERNRYEIDHVALDALYEDASQRALSVAGIYHSHNEVGAYFSAIDRVQALSNNEPTYPLYMVAGVRRAICDELKAFVWSGQDFIEVPL